MPDNENQKRLKSQIHATADFLTRLMHQPSPPPAIGLDLDGCIDEASEFFKTLAQVWPGPVFVITYRRDQAKAEADVAKFGIQCDEVILVSSFQEKAEAIARKHISVYVDDQDEILQHVSEGVTVPKIRNGGNCDFESKEWLFSETTGKMI